MKFNSLIFVLFFILVYAGYLLLQRKVKAQNILLLVASYIFYGFWDWRFLSLLMISTCIDFVIGQLIASHNNARKRKQLVTISAIANLSMLGVFKYFNFFAESFSEILILLGMKPDFATLNIILPIGISFYTFQTLSYTIDIYRNKLQPTNRIIDFALFVSFFPQLVAGPIERAVNLLPQIASKRKIEWSQIDAGIFLILWGYFKKLVIADNVGPVSDTIFNGYLQYQGVDLLIGALAFMVQIYCDFSAYSDIARGLCKLMGFELMVNFRLPFFALNPSDFWARWHISLSSWLRDYLYVSIGGNRQGRVKTYRNLMVTMLLGGLWHGAAWNFVIWGLYHGTILGLYRAFDNNPELKNPWSGRFSYLRILTKMGLMFVLTLIGWVIFRSQSIDQLGYMLMNTNTSISKNTFDLAYTLMFFALPLFVVQFYQYISGDLLIVVKRSAPFRAIIYGLLFTGIFIFGVRTSLEFIYFQF